MVTCGAVALYNMYLPGNKHAPRLEQKIEDVYKQVSGEELVTGRNYLQIEVGGTIIETGEDFQMPPIKYVFMWKLLQYKNDPRVSNISLNNNQVPLYLFS